MNMSHLKNVGHIYRVDKFRLPAAAREEFFARVRATHELLRTIPGFIEDFLLEEVGATFETKVVTIAVWRDAEALASAKAFVQEQYKKIGFNPAELIKRLGIEADMAAYVETSV